MPDLKPCPFCGAATELDYQQSFRALSSGKIENQVAIYCTACNAGMSLCYSDHPECDHDQLAAILVENWNTRPERTAFLPTKDGEFNGDVQDDTSGKCGELVTVETQYLHTHPWGHQFWSDESQYGGIVSYETRELVIRSQAEKLLAAAIRRERDLAEKQLSEVVDRMSDDYLVLKADNAVKDARIKEWEKSDRLVAKALWEDKVKALEAKLAAANKALEPFAHIAEYDIGDSESDDDIYRPMDGRYAVASLIRVGDLRRAHVAWEVK